MSAGVGAHAFRIRRSPGLLCEVALMALMAAGALEAQPLGTVFTYQGRLTDAGTPASGSYDLQLRLFDAASGGAQVGPTLTRDDVVVASGLFTVSLDFGTVFSGNKRWLEIGVRPGASTGGFTALGRQELTPSPNAAFSLSTPWTGVSSKPAGFADDTDNDVLGGLSCANGQIAKWSGSAWTCGADADSGGDITGVAAGTGLTGGGTTGAVTLNVNLAGSGAATTVARSDHIHFGQTWTGAGTGLHVESTTVDGLQGFSTATGGSVSGVLGQSASSDGSGVFGIATSSTGQSSGVRGESSSTFGVGVLGAALSTTGPAWGVNGISDSTHGIGVLGTTTATTGGTVGLFGDSSSTEGYGVYGVSGALSGTSVGVLGVVNSPMGFGGRFRNLSSGTALWVDGAAGIGTASPAAGTLLDVAGIVRSSTGGFRFPDGTTQTTAAVGSSGDITSVLTPVTSGLTGGAASGDVTLGVNFSGSGASTSVSRSDHNHLGQTWSGSLTSSVAFRAINTGGGAGFTDGAWGQSDAAGNARGVVGYATSATGQNYGVWGQLDSAAGRAVFGTATNGSGPTYGVYGQTASTGGLGVYGQATAGSGSATGVQGDTSSPTGRGVFGHAASAASGSTYGVFGQSDAAGDGRGVGGSGVFGVFGMGSRAGTFGTDTTVTFNGAGIWGQSVSTDNGAGLFGQALGTTGLNYGVYATTASVGGYAGFFVGRVNVTGTLSKGGGSFKIDHPLDPERKYLYHSFVESPDMKNIYDGTVVTDADGYATVDLPDWFEALNRDFRYQLTVVDEGDHAGFVQAKVIRKVADHRFSIRTSAPGIEVSWQVTGIRHDAFAEKHRIPVEEIKDPDEQGTYLYPVEQGRPAEKGLDFKRQPMARRPPLP